MLRWISHKYGFGTYMHLFKGYLSKDTIESTKRQFDEILSLSSNTRSNVYIDTMISPSYTSAIAQAVQMPSISGKDFNMILFEYTKGDKEALFTISDNFALVKTAYFDVCSSKALCYSQRCDVFGSQYTLAY